MNRIILIGNGFDLAHDMKTSYNDFINDFWEEKIKNIRKQLLDYGNSDLIYEDDDIKTKPFSRLSLQKIQFFRMGKILDFENFSSLNVIDFYKNNFLNIITKKNYERWVDIEDVYYEQLKNCLNPQKFIAVDGLHHDFENIKSYLQKYLQKVDTEFTKNFNNKKLVKHIKDKIYSKFRLRDFTEKATDDLTKEIINYFIINDIEALEQNAIDFNDIHEISQKIIPFLKSIYGDETELSKISKNKVFKIVKKHLQQHEYDYKSNPENILFLNFNYTHTENFYLDKKYKNQEIIHIHGSIKEELNNPIIFGYGDEIDKDYQNIENLNDNRFLDNIKSVKYLETNNYKKLLDFISSESYQIFIFGHSCGISDRTLLNTLFEHENCHSIKLFYHEYWDEKIKQKRDNYSEIVKNITRNFNDKALLRDKVVNKEYCEPIISVNFKKEHEKLELTPTS